MNHVAAFTGSFEYHSPGCGAIQRGSCRVEFDAETLTLVGPDSPIALDLGDIDVFEPGEYDLRLVLYTRDAIRLTRFGKAFQDLQHHLLAAYRDRLVKCLLVSDLDEVARYAGRISLEGDGACEGPAEIRLYESNIAVLPDRATGFQWRVADIDHIEFDERDYRVVLTRGGERLAVGRLAKRTGEFVERVRERIALLAQRSARLLHALFPFLSPGEFQQVAARMREGVSAPIRDLRPLHGLIEQTLLGQVVDASLRPYLGELIERSDGDWHVGFTIVRQEPPERDDEVEASTPDVDEDEASPREEPGERVGATPDAAVTKVGDGLEALHWFFLPLRSRSGAVEHLAWEATSRGGRATYVFAVEHAAGAGDVTSAVHAINRGLVALNFRREPIYLPADGLVADARYRHYAIAARRLAELTPVRRAFSGRVIHRSMPAWRQQLDRLLGT